MSCPDCGDGDSVANLVQHSCVLCAEAYEYCIRCFIKNDDGEEIHHEAM